MKFNLSSLCLLAVFLITEVRPAFALNKPNRVSTTYNAAHDLVVVKWGQVTSADKYRLVVRNSTGKTVIRSSSSSLVKKFPGSKFQRLAEYKVQVQSVEGHVNSKFTSRKYVHLLSRAAGKGKLLTTNSFGRSGNYYLPQGFDKGPKPLMVGFHGQGGAGDSMVNAFANYAEKFGFIIIAPSSGLFTDETASWEIEQSGAPTADFNHIKDCIAEVRAFVDVQIDPTRVLSIGYSAGGAVAPYFATSAVNSEFTHFAVLHGGVVFDTFGPRLIPAWLSTGTTDTLRPPSELQGYRSDLQARGFNAIYTEYDTDHGLAKEERRDVVDWWLGK